MSKKTTSFFFLIFFILFSSFVFGQQKNIASIRNLIENNAAIEAIEKTEELLELDQNNPILLNLRAIATIFQSSVNDETNNKIALIFLTKAIKIDSLNAELFYNRSWVNMALNKNINAWLDAQKAVSLDSSNVLYQNNVLKHFWLMKKNKEALLLAEKQIKKFPNDGYAYHVRGNLKRDFLKKYIEGNEDLKKSEELKWQGGFHLIY
jgi:tetratricopeptide (TPR) repeat protein